MEVTEMEIGQIMAISVGLLTLLFLALSLKIMGLRREHKVPHSNETDSKAFLDAVDAQRNFERYTSYTLILFLVLMLFHAEPMGFLVLNLTYFVGRVIHAYGVLVKEQSDNPSLVWRMAGMKLTFLTILVSGIWIFILKGFGW